MTEKHTAKTDTAAHKRHLSWLNSPPREIQKNDDDSEYVPIQIVQEDLQEGFKGQTKFELLREVVTKDWIYGVGRLHYRDPVTKEWLSQDGSAAVPQRGNLRLDFPALGAHILLNAAKKIGKRFGQELNRENETGLIVDDPFIGLQIGDSGGPSSFKHAPDDAIIASYKEAVQRGDFAKVQTIKAIYNIPPDA
jgi:hypothetical protein